MSRPAPSASGPLADSTPAHEPQRWVELVLVSPDGVLLGKLPAVPVDVPWWPEVNCVVRAVRQRYGVEVVVLRLLEADRAAPHGGRVTYLAEIEAPIRCEPCDFTLDDHPLRNTYAKPAGPRADLDWALAVLSEHGLTPQGTAEQIKTWNLSSLWRIPLGDGAAWLKVVPPFFGHEGALIAALQPHGGVPQLLGYEHGRVLMREVPGVDGFDADLAQRQHMIDLLVRLVNGCRADTSALLALGLADFRAHPLSEAIAQSVERHAAELDVEDARCLSRFVKGLERRWSRVAECGLPDGLIHGDFHSGNVRITDEQFTLIDWGDAGIGHPLLDQAAFLEPAPEAQRGPLREHLHDRWRLTIPGCDPARAEHWLKPIAAARQAVIYDYFLSHIEPAEHPYHRSDPALWLRRTAQATNE